TGKRKRARQSVHTNLANADGAARKLEHRTGRLTRPPQSTGRSIKSAFTGNSDCSAWPRRHPIPPTRDFRKSVSNPLFRHQLKLDLSRTLPPMGRIAPYGTRL